MYACVNYLSHKANMQKFIELKKYKFPAFLSVTQNGVMKTSLAQVPYRPTKTKCAMPVWEVKSKD